jgi:hypothetical protein
MQFASAYFARIFALEIVHNVICWNKETGSTVSQVDSEGQDMQFSMTVQDRTCSSRVHALRICFPGDCSQRDLLE